MMQNLCVTSNVRRFFPMIYAAYQIYFFKHCKSRNGNSNELVLCSRYGKTPTLLLKQTHKKKIRVILLHFVSSSYIFKQLNTWRLSHLTSESFCMEHLYWLSEVMQIRKHLCYSFCVLCLPFMMASASIDKRNIKNFCCLNIFKVH